ncbi:hypothetical protein AM274_16010 [Pseudomonas nunensis]|nr:hypothetical protein AM274_16010 [Pseudomonas nunensis]
MEIKNPKGESSLGDTEIEHSIKQYENLKSLPPNIKRPLTICLNRLNQSVNTWGLVQQAIDFKVALEAVLTPSENTENFHSSSGFLVRFKSGIHKMSDF